MFKIKHTLKLRGTENFPKKIFRNSSPCNSGKYTCFLWFCFFRKPSSSNDTFVFVPVISKRVIQNAITSGHGSVMFSVTEFGQPLGFYIFKRWTIGEVP